MFGRNVTFVFRILFYVAFVFWCSDETLLCLSGLSLEVNLVYVKSNFVGLLLS